MKTPFPKYDDTLVGRIEEYLDMHYLTSVATEVPVGDDLIVTSAVGRGMSRYARPMFQVIPHDAFSGSCLSYTPCPACDDWSRSWNCPDHHEIPWDAEKREWKEGPTAVTNFFTRYYQAGRISDEEAGHLDRSHSRVEGEALQSEARPNDDTTA